MPVGHSPPSSLLSACKSSFGLAMVDGPHHAPFLFWFQDRDMESQYHRIANFGWYMVGWPRIANKKYASYPSFHHYLMSPAFAYEDLTMVRGRPILLKAH